MPTAPVDSADGTTLVPTVRAVVDEATSDAEEQRTRTQTTT
ncbi:hypothetical protein [Haloplanus vescus]|nr:hypothetical protein [Haloplanus vescus]